MLLQRKFSSTGIELSVISNNFQFKRMHPNVQKMDSSIIASF